MTCSREPIFLFVVTAAALGLGSCQEEPGDSSPIDRARVEMAAGDALDAQILLQRSLEDGAPREELAALLGEAALMRGDPKAAREWLEPGDFSVGTRARGFQMLGRLELSEGKLAAAGQAFDRALAAGPPTAGLWVDIGRLRYRGGEQMEALEAAETALAIEAGDPEALRFRGQLARDADGLEAGVRLFARAIASHPCDTALRVEYAATLGDAGRAREALAVLRGGDGLVVGTAQGLFVQAVIAARGGRSILARELLQRSGLDRDGVPAAQMLSAIIDLEGENYASAALELTQLRQRQPDNPRVADLLAFALSRSGRERELIDRFAGAAAASTGSAYLRTLVGRAHESLGEREQAALYLDLAADAGEGIAPLPSQPATAADEFPRGGEATRDYVRDAIAQRQPGEGLRRAREFASNAPGSGDAFAILGDAEFAQGNKRAAREAYERSARIRSNWPLTLRLAGTLEDPRSVRRLLEDYLRAHPMNGEAAAVLADAYASQGRWTRAVRLLDHAMDLGMARVPWVLAARSVGAAQLDDPAAALDYALAAHELQPMNRLAIAALIAALPAEEEALRIDLTAKLDSLADR